MSSITPGSLRPEQKQDIQLKKNDIIRKCIYCVKSYNLTQSDQEIIYNILITLTYHRVGAYQERLAELNQLDFVLRGINATYSNNTQSQAVVRTLPVEQVTNFGSMFDILTSK